MKTVYSEDYERFLDCLIAVRKAADVTQQQLAQRLGKPQSFVSKYERRERRIDVVELVALCAALGADPCALIEKAGLWPRAAESRRKQK